MLVNFDLSGFAGSGGGGEFGVCEATISGKGAAAETGRDEDFAAALVRNGFELWGEPHLDGGADRMQGNRCFGMVHLEPGEQLVVDKFDAVHNLEAVEALLVFRRKGFARMNQSIGARATVNHDGRSEE